MGPPGAARKGQRDAEEDARTAEEDASVAAEEAGLRGGGGEAGGNFK